MPSNAPEVLPPVPRHSDSLWRNRPIFGASVVFLLLGTLLVSASLVSFQLLSSVRGFAIAEGRWSEAQKRAVLWLHRYGDSADEAHWQAYLDEIRVPVTMRQAREGLIAEVVDKPVVREAFRTGRVPEHLIGAMISLVRWFGDTRYVSASLGIWAQGDAAIVEIRGLAADLHATVLDGGDAAATIPILARINEVDARLSLLERRFTRSVEASGRLVERILTGLLVGIAVLLAAGTGLGLWYAERQIAARERALVDSERRYRSLLDRMREVIFETDGDGRLRFLSPAWVRLTGVPAEELLGLPLWQLGRLRDNAEVPVDPHMACLAMLNGRTDAATWDVTITSAQGQSCILEVDVSLPAESESEPALVGRISNVTERREMHARLAETGRLQAMGHLAGGIAHDFNNVLTAIVGHSDLAQRANQQGDTEVVARSLESIQQSSETVSTLTRQLLTFSRPVQQLDLVDANETIERISVMLERLLPEPITLTSELSAGLTPVRVGGAHLDQVLMNLVINARDAMTSGGVITVRTRMTRSDEDPILANASRVGDYVEICVIDQGGGIAPETRAHIFEPYFSTKAQHGTGMGLAIAYGVVRDAGGVIDVATELGSGSCFRVLLPAAQGGKVSGEKTRKEPVLGSLMASVLVVEDEQAVREVMVRALEREGFSVLAAASGSEALELLDDHPSVAVLVSDVVMPDMPGPRLRAAIIRRIPAIATVYVSGYTGDVLDPSELAEDGVSFLQKPFRPAALAAAVRRALDTQAIRG